MYHINDKQDVKKCSAKNSNNCPFEKHFDKLEDGWQFLSQSPLIPEIDNSQTIINKFVKEYASLYDLDSIVGSDDIYNRAKLLMYAKNHKKYPYKNNLDDLTAEEKSRISQKAKSMNLKAEALAEVAVSSLGAWTSIVLPSVEKQVYQEAALFKHLKQQFPNYTMVNLPSGGVNAKYLVNGEIVSGFKNRPKNYPKSLDFHIRTEDNQDIFVVAKYTVGEGGSQDNQAKDAQLALHEMTLNSPVKLVAVLDGSHYQKTIANQTMNRLDNIKEEFIYQKGLEQKAFVGTYQEAAIWLKQHK